MSNTEVRDDTDDSLETIRKKYGGSLSSALIELQGYKQHEEGEPAWMNYVQNLPCVRIPPFRPRPLELEPKRVRTSSSATMLAMKSINTFENGRYAAISYRWDKSEWEDGAIGGYQCTTVGSDRPKTCPIRSEIIDRVVSFCHDKKCDLFWIDQLCVDQQNESRKQTAILAMHQVYRQSKFPLAMLSIPINCDDDLRLLSLILGESMRNKERVLQDKAFILIQKLVSDPWWKSAWTYHEDYLSSTNLTLLIPHSPKLNELKTELNRGLNRYCFGCLPNELCVNSADFRTALSTFCSYYQASFDYGSGDWNACQDVLQTAPKYTRLLCYKDDGGFRGARVSMSPYIFADIAKRRIKELSDRSAIASNCCEYPVTVGPQAIKRGWSPSLVLLALYLLNGEILMNDENPRDLLQVSVLNFLKKHSFKSFESPMENSLTFFKNCRFANPELTEWGVKVNGLLWKLSKPKYVPINGRVFELGSQCGLGWPQRRRLRQLEMELRFGSLGSCYEQLAKDVYGYLDEDEQWRGEKTPSKEYKDIMANEIVAAMNEGKPLRLGCILDANAEVVHYRGIFICDSEADSEEAYVFTSFQDGNKSWKDLPKNVSMDVEVPKQGWVQYSTPFLRMKRWRNGLIFFGAEKVRPFVFPWPAGFL